MDDKMKLRFYPRDIGLWRKTFTWNGISEPSRLFDNEESFREFCARQAHNTAPAIQQHLNHTTEKH